MITVDQTSIIYDGNGVALTYSFPFKALEGVHVHARILLPDDTADLLAYGTDYTVDLLPGEGGTVTLTNPVAVGNKLRLFRMTPRTQLVDLTPGGEFKAEEVETQLDKTVMLAQEALAGSYESTDPSGFMAMIEEERWARATADEAIAGRTLTLEARLGNPSDTTGSSIYAKIAQEQSVRASIDSAQASDMTTLISRVGNPADTAGNTAFAKANNAASTAATASSATAALSSAVSASLSGLTTSINAEISSRSSVDVSLSSAVATNNATVTASVASLSTAVSTATSARVSVDASLSTAVVTNAAAVTASVSSLVTSITSEATARLSVDASLSTGTAVVSNAVVAASNSLASAVISEASARVSADNTQATMLTALTASVGDPDDSANTNGTLYARVAQEVITRAEKDGQLYGAYVLKVSAGGKVASMSMVADAPIGAQPVTSVSFLADSFKIYNGTTDVAPFQVEGGVVRVNGDLIATGTITGDKIVANAQIDSPVFVGGRLTLGVDTEHVICTSSDTGGIRMNGGSTANAEDEQHGGQLDLRGDEDLAAGGIVRGSAVLTAAQISDYAFSQIDGDYVGEAVVRARGLTVGSWGGYIRARRNGSVMLSTASGDAVTFETNASKLTVTNKAGSAFDVPYMVNGILKLPSAGDHTLCTDVDTNGLRINGGSAANDSDLVPKGGQLDLRGIFDVAASGIIRGSAILTAAQVSGLAYSHTDGNYAGEAVVRARGLTTGSWGGYMRARRNGSIQLSTASGDAVTFETSSSKLTVINKAGTAYDLPYMINGVLRIPSAGDQVLCTDVDTQGLRINGGMGGNDSATDQRGGQIDLRGASDTEASGILRGAAIVTAAQIPSYTFNHTDGNYVGEAVIRACGLTAGTWGGFCRTRRDGSVQLSTASGTAISFDISGNNLIVKFANGTTKTIAMT